MNKLLVGKKSLSQKSNGIPNPSTAMQNHSHLSIQTVVVNGKHSIAGSIISGVPQGTVLGPILFIIFINDMHLCIKESTVRLFADDSRIS